MNQPRGGKQQADKIGQKEGYSGNSPGMSTPKLCPPRAK